ncbi:MAG: dynamin family protein [Planctomycetota bacterium]|nr:dynamin family protein [Planctomycetota bacterium]
MSGGTEQNKSNIILNKIRAACERFHIATLKRQVAACEGLAVESRFIDVAVLGQFKAGKSSFINSLIGAPVLPVGVVPVTTVITRLRYGNRQRTVVTFSDGIQSEVDTSSLDEFISESQNPANRKNVRFVDVELPSLQNYSGPRLVDTPGLGSVFTYHMETAENWLPWVGVALVAISAERPLSKNDLALLRELLEYTPEIVLLLTKADLLLPDQQNEVVQFIHDTVQREFRCDFPVFHYSTKVNTQLYRQRLDSELLLALSRNCDEEFGEIFHHKVHSLARSCTGYLEIALKASLQADYDRDELKRLILDEKVNYDLIRSELFLIARENMIQTRSLIARHLEDTQRLPLTRKITEKLRQAMPSWKGNLWKFTRQYEQWLRETMTEELQQVSATEHRQFLGTLEKARASIQRSVMLFKNLLDRNIEKVLGIKLAEAEWKIEVAEPDNPDVSFSRSFDFHLDLLWFLIPMVIFRKAN